MRRRHRGERAAASRPGPVLVSAGAGLRPPSVRAAAPGAGAGSVAVSHRPINPFMPRSPSTRPALHHERSFTNITEEDGRRPSSPSHGPSRGRRVAPSLLPFARSLAGASGSAVPARPRWLLAIPAAIRQLDALDRELLTRRDIERLFGVSKVRAAQLMATFGAGRTGHILTLPRAALLRQLRRYRKRAAFRGEEARRERVVTAIRQALTNDYEQFEALVEAGEAAGGGGEGRA